MRNNKIQSLWVIFLCLLLHSSCGGPREKEAIQKQMERNVISGKELSKKHCQSCHLYPEPSELDKKTWERSVLPLMGRLFGVYESEVPRSKILEGAINRKAVEESNMFPETPSISSEDWQKIKDYYLAEAPEVLKW